MQWPKAAKPCALAALVATLVMLLGLHPLVALPSVGFLAVIFYRQKWPGAEIKAATGARLGALSGPLCFVMSAGLKGLLIASLHQWPELRAEILKKMQESASGTSDPQVLAFFDYVKTPDGFALLMGMALVFGLILSIVLGTLGGAVAGTIMGRRNRP